MVRKYTNIDETAEAIQQLYAKIATEPNDKRSDREYAEAQRLCGMLIGPAFMKAYLEASNAGLHPGVVLRAIVVVVAQLFWTIIKDVEEAPSNYREKYSDPRHATVHAVSDAIGDELHLSWMRATGSLPEDAGSEVIGSVQIKTKEVGDA